MMSDPIADLLTRMKNACMAKHSELQLPHSRLKEELVKLMVKTGNIGSYAVKERQLIIKQPRFTFAKRLSKPGSRLYAESKQLWPYLRGRGVTILSNSQGLMTAREAFKKKLGGELLCKII